MNKIREWYNANKDVPLFKGKLLLVFLIILAIAVNYFCNDRETHETPTEAETSAAETAAEETDRDLLLVFFDNSKAHFVVFFGLTATLAVVKKKKEQKLRESK